MSKITSHDDTLATLAEAPTSRRAFLRAASLTAVGGAIVACGTGAGQSAASVEKSAAPTTPAANAGTAG